MESQPFAADALDAVDATSPLDAVDALIRARRSSLLMDTERPVPDTVIDRLCELATWAPNHKRTWPWQFAVFTHDGRARLGEAFAQDLAAEGTADAGKIDKTRTKYRRAPAIIVVGCAAHDHPTFHAENRDAVAAGIQTLLLGATAAGLASYWSTAPVMSGTASLTLCGFSPDTRIIGVVYLGWPTAEVAVPERPTPVITRVVS